MLRPVVIMRYRARRVNAANFWFGLFDVASSAVLRVGVLVSVSELELVRALWCADGGSPDRSDGVYAPFHQGFRCYRARCPRAVSPRVPDAVVWPLPTSPFGGRGGSRVIVDAILYVVDNGITWRALPADCPPWPTVYQRFAAWGEGRCVAATARRTARPRAARGSAGRGAVGGGDGLAVGARGRHRRPGHAGVGRREEGRGP
ncbi:transposase [Saccharothrix syringae]|uniref:Transposase n=1 Tax=Saccharothrix syringae TaxID=103733 RepID=A0A5Q0GV72_SACSY|nr:transposase [Saccharothrix syringae]